MCTHIQLNYAQKDDRKITHQVVNSGILRIVRFWLFFLFLPYTFCIFQIFYSDLIFYNKKLLRRKLKKICVEQGQKKDILIKYILKKENNRKNETTKILKVLPHSWWKPLWWYLKIRNKWQTMMYYIQKVLDGQVTSCSLLTSLLFRIEAYGSLGKTLCIAQRGLRFQRWRIWTVPKLHFSPWSINTFLTLVLGNREWIFPIDQCY